MSGESCLQAEGKFEMASVLLEGPATPETVAISPLRTLFVITSMPVGGAETLLVNLIRNLDREQVEPELCCLKEPGPLGELLSSEVPVHSRLLKQKYDLAVLGRLTTLMRRRQIAAVVTVGAGDKMFWGRLAARRASVPVVVSALHSTGWPDGVNWMNRRLTPLTDAFIAVAREHGRFLVEHERFPPAKVRIIPNGVDTERFRPQRELRGPVRAEFGLPVEAPVCGIVAALRPEKNVELFLHAAELTRRALPEACFLIVGDGPERAPLQARAEALGLRECLRFTGSRTDIPRLLAAMDCFSLTSHVEANPVSILEAMACELPVVATRVGSVAESVIAEETGFLVEPGQAEQLAEFWQRLLRSPAYGRQLGAAGRQRVLRQSSLSQMVRGYERLLWDIYRQKAAAGVR